MIKNIICMGVSGCGKSSLAQALSQQLNWPMIEADDYHPAANLSKMQAGIALNDADRAPWLDTLRHTLSNYDHAVMSCSALKASYRKRLIIQTEHTLFVHLHGTYTSIAARLALRTDHFMPAKLLKSQFEALELPNLAIEPQLNYITVSTELPLSDAITCVIDALKQFNQH